MIRPRSFRSSPFFFCLYFSMSAGTTVRLRIFSSASAPARGIPASPRPPALPYHGRRTTLPLSRGRVCQKTSSPPAATFSRHRFRAECAICMSRCEKLNKAIPKKTRREGTTECQPARRGSVHQSLEIVAHNHGNEPWRSSDRPCRKLHVPTAPVQSGMVRLETLGQRWSPWRGGLPDRQGALGGPMGEKTWNMKTKAELPTGHSCGREAAKQDTAVRRERPDH